MIRAPSEIERLRPLDGWRDRCKAARAMRRLCLLVPLVAGCLGPDDDLLLLDERFEAPVGDRWIVQGAVAQVETIHPAEHGLQFTDWTDLSGPLTIQIFDEFSDGNWLEYSSSCVGSPELWLQWSGVGNSFELWVDLGFEEDGTPDQFQRVHANLPPVAPSDDWANPTTISGIHLVSGPSACVIDNLRIYQPSPEYAY